MEFSFINNGLRLIAVLLLVLATSCKQNKTYDPNDYFSRQEQDSILYKTARYTAKLPPGSTQATKFNKEFDSYFKAVAKESTFLQLFKEEDGTIDFLITKPAKSITRLFEGIGGKLKMNTADSIVEYDEIFRTWKMSDKDLTERGRLLFDRMVTKRDLTIFYSKYTGDKYIEFPDDRFTFDKKKRMWIDHVPFDSVNAPAN